MTTSLWRTLTLLVLTGLIEPIAAGAQEPNTTSTAAAFPDSVLAVDQATTLPGSTLAWYDATLLPLEGTGWEDTDTTYSRLPSRAKGKVTDAVWGLSHDTSGLCVRFITDATSISALWDGGKAMVHMAATGVSGLDLYRRDGKQWIFCGVGRPKETETSAVLKAELPGTPTEYLLYLPLYQKLTQLKIGICDQARLAPAPPRPEGQKPIVFYGTSITQGGCASRCGMSHPAILGRWLGYEVINLGFSGSGKMEPAMAEFLVEIDPALYVLECLPNMTPEQVQERLEPFVHKLREHRPKTPILMVENPILPADHELNRAHRTAYENLQKAGVSNLHFLEGAVQLAGPENGTVDGVHPTDLGFLRMAQAYEPVLRKILGLTP